MRLDISAIVLINNHSREHHHYFACKGLALALNPTKERRMVVVITILIINKLLKVSKNVDN